MERLRQLLEMSGNDAQLNLLLLLVNFIVGAIIGMLLKAHYVRYGRSLSNRELFASTFVPVILSVLLIISIIKSSLTLSLGLVGALSIVRFRTPIKEPEELVYLFLAIAAGIGLGANQTVIVSVAMLVILGLLTALAGKSSIDSQSIYFEIEVTEAVNAQESMAFLKTLIAEHTALAKLRRFESSSDGLLACFSLRCPDGDKLAQLTQKVREKWSSARVTSLDQDQHAGL